MESDKEFDLSDWRDTPEEAKRRARIVVAMRRLFWFKRLQYGQRPAVEVWMKANRGGVLLPSAYQDDAARLLLDVSILRGRMGSERESGVVKVGVGFFLVDYIPAIYGALDLRDPEHNQAFIEATDNGVGVEYWSKMVKIDR